MDSWSHSAEHCANKLLTCCYWQISENISNKWYFSATCILKATAIIYKITSYGYMEVGEAFCEQLRLWTVWSLRWNHLDPFNPCRHIWQSWIFFQFLDDQILWIHIFNNICYNLNYFCGISMHHSVCLAIFLHTWYQWLLYYCQVASKFHVYNVWGNAWSETMYNITFHKL